MIDISGCFVSYSVCPEKLADAFFTRGTDKHYRKFHDDQHIEAITEIMKMSGLIVSDIKIVDLGLLSAEKIKELRNWDICFGSGYVTKILGFTKKETQSED